MSADQPKHVFISYVHEDKEAVAKLCRVLEAARIPYWRDRKDLGPGDAWKAKIRDAIREDALVFLACFSDNSRAKTKSHMNEELTIAVEEFRKMPPQHTWLIPVRLDSGEPPAWELGAGKVMGDLNYSSLFGDEYAEEAASLVTTIHQLMGSTQVNPASALEAIDQATATDRVSLVKTQTKTLLPDPAKRIEIDDLVSQESQRITTVLNDTTWASGGDAQSPRDHAKRVVTEAQRLLDLTMPFCASLQVAVRWGSPDGLGAWTSGIKSLAQSAVRMDGGWTDLLALRHLPVVTALMTVSLASTASGRWDNLKALILNTTVRDPRLPQPVSLLDATDPYRPFENNQLNSSAATYAARSDKPLEDTIRAVDEGRLPLLISPVADLLFTVLRPVFSDQLTDDDSYESEFDRAEVMLGLLSQDEVNVRLHTDPTAWGVVSWFGRATWRVRQTRINAVEELRVEFGRDGASWGPLKAGLFGGDVERAADAFDRYGNRFDEITMLRQ